MSITVAALEVFTRILFCQFSLHSVLGFLSSCVRKINLLLDVSKQLPSLIGNLILSRYLNCLLSIFDFGWSLII